MVDSTMVKLEDFRPGVRFTTADGRLAWTVIGSNEHEIAARSEHGLRAHFTEGGLSRAGAKLAPQS